MNTPPLVVLNGLPHSGKGVVADFLINKHGFTRHKLAKPIKDMLRALPGITEEHIEGNLKELPTPLLNGKSPRWAMQTLGKQWRETMESDDPNAPDFLCVLWGNGRPPGPVVVDDLRYPQEVTFFKKLGAKILRIERPDVSAPDTGHEAEKQQLRVDGVLQNTGTIEDLEVVAAMCLRELGLDLVKL
jgi:hypothetical protein